VKKASNSEKKRSAVSYGRPADSNASLTASMARQLNEMFAACRALFEAERYDDLETLGREWIAKFPKQAAKGWDVVGLALMQRNRLEESEAALLIGLELEPENLDILDRLGVVRNRRGLFGEADEAYQKALALAPKLMHVITNTAGNLNDARRHDEALALAERALQIRPEDRLGLLVKANALVGLKRLDDGIATYRRLIEVAPDWPDGWANLGAAYKDRNMIDESIEATRRSLELNPMQAAAWNNLGLIYQAHKRDQEALDCFNKAIDIEPGGADPYVNLGTLLQVTGRTFAALEYLEHARQLRPTEAMAYLGLGSCYQDLGRFDQAVLSYCTALELRPDFGMAFSNLLFALNYHPTLPAEEIFRMYQEFETNNALAAPGAWAPHANSREPGRRLRVGYVSPDFISHPVRYFLEPLMAHHDHQSVEVFAYSDVVVPDGQTARYREFSDQWRDTAKLTNHQLADLVRADGIDILVDLAGHTANNRLQVFTLKPAPVQVSWLGYVSTTGLASIDYFFCDDALAPVGSEHLLAEKPWRLPSVFVYRPPADYPAPSPLPAASNGYITFGTLSRAIRLNDELLDVWAELLKRVPNSGLVINSRDFREPEMCDWMIGRLESRGIDPARLHVNYMTPAWIPMTNIDIMLDCFPHNSGTTLAESLYFGVPVVSMVHRPTVGRVGSSMLHAINRPEWVANDVDGYLRIATELAGDIPALAQIRAGLRDEMRSSPLMDEPGFARTVEDAYRSMWQQYCVGKQA
jgi:predicted O-linked N-acetylglucosamine transferase (SPINDLY family)